MPLHRGSFLRIAYHLKRRRSRICTVRNTKYRGKTIIEPIHLEDYCQAQFRMRTFILFFFQEERVCGDIGGNTRGIFGVLDNCVFLHIIRSYNILKIYLCVYTQKRLPLVACTNISDLALHTDESVQCMHASIFTQE